MSARKTGRPEKPEADARSARIAFRVTETERAQIEAAAAAVGVTVSDYARALVMTARPPRQPRGRAGAAVLSELNRAGVNLNQIARTLNRGGSIPPDLGEAIAEVRAVIEKLAGGDE
jgi:hypothetical protein